MNPYSELIERYRRGSEIFLEALSGVPEEILDREPRPGKWSIRQIAIHLADSEIVCAARFRFIAAEPGCTIASYDQDRWAQRLAYEKQSVSEAATLFRALRDSTAAMLRNLPPAAWENRAYHTERGQVDLRSMVELYAAHAENHARQIREIREQYTAAASA